MCPAGSDHVMTTDPTRRQQSCGHPPRWLRKAGARYRPHLPSPPLDTVLEGTEDAALRYARGGRDKDPHPPAGALVDFARTFTELLRRHLHTSPPPPDFRSFSPRPTRRASPGYSANTSSP
jgi:hypothetical protein